MKSLKIKPLSINLEPILDEQSDSGTPVIKDKRKKNLQNAT